MTDYQRVHREINRYIPDAPKMSKRELNQAVLDSFFKGQKRYRRSASKLVDGYITVKGGVRVWDFKDHWGNVRHVTRDAKGRFVKWLD